MQRAGRSVPSTESLQRYEKESAAHYKPSQRPNTADLHCERKNYRTLRRQVRTSPAHAAVPNPWFTRPDYVGNRWAAGNVPLTCVSIHKVGKLLGVVLRSTPLWACSQLSR